MAMRREVAQASWKPKLCQQRVLVAGSSGLIGGTRMIPIVRV